MTIADAAEILGIRADASSAEIEKAFSRRARLSHPDRFAHSSGESAAAAAEFIRIADARALLLRHSATYRITTGTSAEARASVAMSEPVAVDRGVALGPIHGARRSLLVWSALLVVTSFFAFLGGAIPLSPWNLLLLLPLDYFAIGYGRSGRRPLLVGAILLCVANAVVAVWIVSFGSLVALELLFAPVIALVVIGRRYAARSQRAAR